MSVSRFIARRLSDGETSQKGKISSISNKIAWISVAISIAVMIIAIAVVLGFKREIREKATGFMGSLQLVAPGQSPINEHYPFADSFSCEGRLMDLDYVRSIDAVAYKSGIVKSGTDIYGLYFKGVDSLYDLSFFEKSLVEGELPDFRGKISNDIIISGRLASMLNYKLGDELIAYFIGDDVKVRKFRICALFDAQLEDVDKTMAVIDLRQVQRLNAWNRDQVSSYEVRISGKKDIDLAKIEMEEILMSYMSNEDSPLFVTSITDIYAHLFDWLALLDLNVLMVLILMIAVAGFNMISAILIILFEKISTIGLLKSLGMTDIAIGKVFMLRAGKIVLKGILWGNVAAIVICVIQKYLKVISLDPDNYFVKYVPIEIGVTEVLILDVAALILIMLILSLSTIFISKISPDKTMRVE